MTEADVIGARPPERTWTWSDCDALRFLYDYKTADEIARAVLTEHFAGSGDEKVRVEEIRDPDDDSLVAFCLWPG